METGRQCDVTRDHCESSANSPPTGAGTVGGRLRAIDVDSQMLLLGCGLEIVVRFGPHIGGVNINEGTGSISN